MNKPWTETKKNRYVIPAEEALLKENQKAVFTQEPSHKEVDGMEDIHQSGESRNQPHVGDEAVDRSIRNDGHPL